MSHSPRPPEREAMPVPRHGWTPQTISWNLTRLCNLGCAHCYLDAKARTGNTREELDTEECLRVIDEIHALNPEALVIMTGGEPLLRPDILDLCRYAAERGLWVVMGTNGTLLDSAMAKALKRVGVMGVGISIDSLAREAHDRFRGKTGAWRKAVDAIHRAKEADLETVIQVSLAPWNIGELPAFVEWAHQKGARAVNFYFLVCTGRGQDQTGLSPEACEEAYHRLYELQCRYRGSLLVNAKCAPQFQRFIHQQDANSPHLRAFQGGCPAATSYLRIGPRGEVTPCPYIPTAGGNLMEQPLDVIWATGEAFMTLRNRDGLGGRCGSCEYRVVCGGCRARALAEHGDLLAEDSSCSYGPTASSAQAITLPAGATYFQEAPAGEEVPWTAEAQAILAKIPPFVRGMVKSRMERHAVKQGLPQITAGMLREIREKRMAFFRNPE